MHGVGKAILAALACAALPASAWEPLWTSAWTYAAPPYAANPVQLFLAADGASFALVDVTYDSAAHAVLAKFESDGTFAWTSSRDAWAVAGEALLDDARVAVVGIDPSGTWLLAANQGSDSVVVFRIDAATGRIKATGARVSVGAPVSVTFLR